MRLDLEGVHAAWRLDLGGATAFVVVHAAPGRRSFGGIRVRAYPDDAAALTDARRLAEAMTRKVLLAGLPAGGAKTVVRVPARGWDEAARRAGMERLGAFVESLGGLYHCGADLGFTDDDEAAVRRATAHVGARSLGPLTARSVLVALDAVCAPASVAVQGLGVVGSRVAADLVARGVAVDGADVDAAAARSVEGVRVVAPETVAHAACDVFSPCAAGGVLDAATIARLRCRVVCGGANNPFAEDADADRLHARGITYVPDVLANAGAVIGGASLALGEPERTDARIAALADTVREVLARAAREDRSPHHVVRELADALLAEALARG